MRQPKTHRTSIVYVLVGLSVALLFFARPLMQTSSPAPQITAPCDCESQVVSRLSAQAIPECPSCEPCDDNAVSVKGKFPQVKYNFKLLDSAKTASLLDARKGWTDDDWEKEALRLTKLNKLKKFTIIAVANSGHLLFTLNWIASLMLVKYEKFLVFCLDSITYNALVERGFVNQAVMAPQKWTIHHIPPGEHKWMEHKYNQLTEAKLRIQLALLQQGLWILFSDVDLVFLSSHVLEHIAYVFGDYCNDVDPASSSCFTDLVYMHDQDTDMNTGFFATRPTPIIIEVFNQTLGTMRKWGVDQLAFNYQIRSIMKIKYTKTFKGLDKLLYPNGMIYVRQRKNEKMGIRPLVFHANYVEGSENKKMLLRNAGFWYVNDEELTRFSPSSL